MAPLSSFAIVMQFLPVSVSKYKKKIQIQDLKNIHKMIRILSENYRNQNSILYKNDYDCDKSAMFLSFVSGVGLECRLFEKELTEYLGVKHAFLLIL